MTNRSTRRSHRLSRSNRTRFTLLEQLEARRLLAGDGLRGEYFDNVDLTAPKLVRTDATVNFDWGYGSPAASVAPDTFSARWTGQVEAPASGTFHFHTVSDDGVRLWVNNQLLVNNWTDHAPTENTGSIALVAGQRYDVKMEYYERGNGATARLLWSGPGVAKQVVPQARLYSTAGPAKPVVAAFTEVASVGENTTNRGMVWFSRGTATEQPLTVHYIAGGTATAGSDYTALPGSITIPAGQVGVMAYVQPIDDATYEGNETVVFTITPADAYTVGAAASSTVTIIENDPALVLPIVTLAATDAAATEAVGSPGQFTISRTGDTSAPLQVTIGYSGSAQLFNDYAFPGDVITIPSGQSSVTFAINPVDDALVEGNETVVASVLPTARYNLGAATSATVTITDNDQPPAGGTSVDLSDLNWTTASSPYSGIKRNLATSGNPLRIGGTTYAKGLGVHSPSSVTYNLNGQYTRFTSYAGVDDAVGNGTADGSVVFEVWVDGALKAASSRRTGADPAEFLDVDITGAQQLRLVTTTGGDSDYKDHADWADAKLHTGPVVAKPTVSLHVEMASTSEGAETLPMVWISRGTPGDAPLTVSYTIGGTATLGVDYSPLPASITIPAGSASVPVLISPIDDASVEGNETIVLTLSPAQAYNLGGTSSGTVTITDNDVAPTLPTVTLTVTDAQAAEGGSSATNPGSFTLTRTGSTGQPLTVTLAVTGTATNGIDYSSVPTSVTIPAGLASIPIQVSPTDDTLVEGNETVTLTVAAGNGYTVGTSSTGTVTIADNDQPPATGESVFLSDLNWASANSPYSGIRKDAATSGNPLRINGTTYSKGIGVHSPSSVVYNLGGQYARFTAAVGIDDAVGNNGSAVFEVWVDGVLKMTSTRRTGADAAQLIDVDVAGGQQLRLVTTVGGDSDYCDHANWADAKLHKPAVKPTITLTPILTSVKESSGPARWTLSRTGSTAQPLTVSLYHEGPPSYGLTATRDADYTLPSSIAIPAGQQSVTLEVAVIDDTTAEPTEKGRLGIRQDDAYTLAQGSYGSDFTIADNETPVVNVLGGSNQPATENGVTYTSFSFVRTGDLDAALTLNLAWSGTAENGVDYEPVGDTVTIPEGVDRATVRIRAIDDAEIEPVETVVVTLLPGTGYTAGENASASVQVWSDDRPVVGVTATDAVATESVDGTDAAVFTFTRSGPTNEPLTLIYSLSGTATPVADYVGHGAWGGSATVQFAQGQSSVAVTLTPVDDVLAEGDETIVVTLSNQWASGTVDPTAASATATLTDDDGPPTGLRAEYFDNADFTAPVATRIDPSVNFHATVGQPWALPTSDADTFSVRWTGSIEVPQAGAYTFIFGHNEAARMWIDGKLVGDNWAGTDATAGTGGNSVSTPFMELAAGRRLSVMIEYREGTASESARLLWGRRFENGLGEIPTPIPAQHLRPAPVPTGGTPLKIIALGDSITEGEKNHASYRFWLDRMLKAAGTNFDFVGARTGVHNSWVGGDNVPPLYPWFDQNHQSRWGAHLDELRQQVSQWAASVPDVALVHIGHNDIRGGQSPASLIEELGQFIDQLRVVNPNMRIAIAQPVKNTSLGFVAAMDQYRALIPGLVATKTTTASPIIVVDQYTGFDPTTMTYDSVHPNEIGEKQIAERFYTAIQTLLGQ